MEARLKLFIEGIDLRHHVDKLRYLTTRREIWKATRTIRAQLHDAISNQVLKAQILQWLTGLALAEYQAPPGVKQHRDGVPVFSVQALREARRERGDGRVLNQVFITLLQKETVELEGRTHTIRCGSVMVMDLDEQRVTYVIRKGLHDQQRISRTIEFQENQFSTASLASTYLIGSDEPFAALHSTGA
jgi:hypothetical protein